VTQVDTTPTETSLPTNKPNQSNQFSQSNQPNQPNQPNQSNPPNPPNPPNSLNSLNSPTTVQTAMESTYKIPNPAVFDGSDTSLGNVNNWAYSVEEYMDLAEIPAAKQTRVAAIFLDKDAKTWYRNNYANSNPSPALKDFLQAFKAQFLITHSADDIVNHLRDIDQGSDNIGRYSTDFEALVLQLGPETDSRLVKPDYLHGLHYKTRNALIPTMTEQETLKELINKAIIIGRNLE